jgi:hypothetical protein
MASTTVRSYPNEKHSGSCRFINNYSLAKRNEYHIRYDDVKNSPLNYLDTQNMLV